VGDEEGVVAIPRHIAPLIAESAVAQEELERCLLRKIEQGSPLPGTYPPDDETLAAYMNTVRKVPDLEISRTSLGSLTWWKLRGPRKQVFLRLGEMFGGVITSFLAGGRERNRVAQMQKSPHLATVLGATARLFPGPISERVRTSRTKRG
jgi:hypothetical protein